MPLSSSMPSARPSGAAAAACRASIPPSCSASCSGRSSTARASIRAPIGQVVGGCVSQVGEQSFNVDAHGVARRRPAAVDRGDHRRHPVRVEPAGDQPGLVARRRRRGRRRRGLRGRGDEPHPDRHQLVQEARPRRADPEDLLRALRDDVAVRGRRAHRREVGASAARTPTASGWRRRSAPPGRGPRAASTASGSRSRRRTSTRRASRRAPRTRSSATRASARRRWRSWRR